MYNAVGLGSSGKLLRQNSQKKPSSTPAVDSPQTNLEFLSLPPNVNGRRRGTLEIRLTGIRWTSAKSYPIVEIGLLWWGQQQQQQQQKANLLNWKQGKILSEPERLLRYEILTSEELFRKYLKAAEPIQVRLVSSRTDSLIGRASIPVPGKLVSFRVGETVEAVGKADIISATGFCLGEISLEFMLRVDKPQRENDKKDMVQKVKKSLPVVIPESSSELSVKGVSVSLQREKQSKTFRSLDNTSRTKVLNYLAGKMIPDSEDGTLSEICSISPAESMMDALHQFDTRPAQRKLEYLKFVDSARMLVESIKFTKAGLKEIVHRTKLTTLSEVTFLIRVKLSTQSTSTKIKFMSSSVSECGEAIFNGKAMTKISIPSKTDDFGFEFLVYLCLGQAFHQRSSTGKQIFLGSSVIKLEELVKSRFACYKRCPVRLASDDISLGMLNVRLELGARGIHFGSEFIDALLVDKENISISSSSSENDIPEHCWTFKPMKHCPKAAHSYYHCQPISCSQDSQGGPGPNDAKELSSKQDSPTHPNGSRENPDQEQGSSRENEPRPMDTQETGSKNTKILLHGMLHFGQLKDVPSNSYEGYFLIVHGFWTDEDNLILTTEQLKGSKSFNYLITFPVQANVRFLERTKNQHMLVELWQKTPDATEKLVGVTRIPLHQFYIAFRDAQLADHLSRTKLPVISIDGWSGIGSPLASDPCGQVQALLAIGTENQIEFMKLSRSLTHTSGDAPLLNRPVIPGTDSENKLQENPESKESSEQDIPPEPIITPSTAIFHQRNVDSYRPISSSNTGKQQSEVANMLSAFIENLAQRLPISSERSTAPCYDQNFADNRQVTPPPQRPPPSVQSSPHSQANRPQMRKTSDLLENLQRALAQRPSETVSSDLLTAPSATTPTEDMQPQSKENKHATAEEKLFKVEIEIEQAVNLPKVSVGKKYGKRSKNRTLGSNQRTELEPSAYVTFEGYNLQPGMPDTVKSHEGIVYTTAIIEGSSNPSWKKKFDVQLPVDLMTNDEKRFILKVWRKAVPSNANQVSSKVLMVPAPMEDAVIGFTAVDLSVFLNGMPSILGWYNIMDFSGRCNGQIKVNIQPLENVTVYKGLEEGVNFQIPLSIDVECGGLDAGNASLSRALKRKFTELEEITQRLKARLFDVTGDENVDPDDEFERDLNTEADEEEDEVWVDPLEDSSAQKRNSQYPNGAGTGQQTRTTNTCSYTMSSDRRVAERSLTGCSDRSTVPSTQEDNDDGHLLLEKLLKEHNLDTLINPHILKNLINPVMSTSESTPMSNPYANLPDSESTGCSSADADMSEESAEGAGSNADKVKLISTALQRTTISDGDDGKHTGASSGQESNEKRSKREAPEGEPMKVNDK